MELIEKELTEKIIGVCIDVSNELGNGFLESVYENSLLIAFEQSGLKVDSQVPINVYFREHNVGQFYADIVVENKVIVEIKSCNALVPEHESQLIHYLKATGYKVGLLVNFGKPKLEWKRFVN